MKLEIHRSDTRGHANHGWLNSYHSFSFANYYNPERMRFGLLRVLNDDVVAGGAGFGTHPHENMEIVSIPLSGALAHKDSTGNEKVIHTNDVQIMSAGSGLMHSEYNASSADPVNFLQIWVYPKERDIKPRYDQKSYAPGERSNKWQNVVAPDNDDAVWINQDAWFSLGDFAKGQKVMYDFHKKDNGLYLFVISGELNVQGEPLQKRDAIAVSEAGKLEIEIIEPASLLAIEVPLA